ncbi:MAG: von Willebrand factor type A domain-containing protein [Anaerolineales bacterium]
MKTYLKMLLLVLVTLAVLITGCSPAATPETRGRTGSQDLQPVYYEEVEAPVEEEAGAPLPAPTATALDAPVGPSTGGTDEPNDQPYGDVFFEEYGVNPRVDTQDDHLSTFAVDVDTASYTVMRRHIGDGYLPPDESVRVEEYVNFFDQEYAPPDRGAFAIHLEGAPSPYAANYHLVRVGLKGYEVSPEERKDVVLTFVIDVSGSMDMENRLGLVKQALSLLVESLRPEDKVGIVVYGSRARTILEPTQLDGNYRKVFRAIDSLRPEGATNAEEGLVLGYRMATQAFEPEAVNRVILCSDGVANVGNTGPDSILAQIRRHAGEGIYLTTVGFGMGNYNDVLLERLANDGDGFYAYVDDIREAERVFVKNLTSTLQVIARDAKVQVDFNPEVVRSYRLLGYENRDVADEDFRNDEVDAGEIGVGHSVTALYEVKFEAGAPESATALTVYLRWEDPDTREVIEMNRSFAALDFAREFELTSPRFQLTTIVAQYAEVLRESYWAKEMGTTLEELAPQARRIAEYLPEDEEVQEFADLVTRAVRLSPTQ